MNFWQWADHHEMLFVIGGLGTLYFVGISLEGLTNLVRAWREKK